MEKHILGFVIFAMASTSFIIGAHVLKDYKSKPFVLTSVYDAMRNNVRMDIEKAFNRNEINYDSRNKRNTADKQVFYDNQPSESHNE